MLYRPGINIAVDKCIVRFKGRSLKTMKVPLKLIPLGFKVWAVAQQGYFLQWIWHRLKQPFGLVAVEPTS